MNSFSSKIAIINANPYVRPPDNILEDIKKTAGKKTSPIPVKGNIEGAQFQQSLVRYQGDWRLYINSKMAKAAGIKFSKSISEIVGKVVQIDLEYDPSPPTYKMTSYLQEALDKNPRAKKNWEKLIPSRQKEILRYFLALTSDEAKQKNVEKVIKALTGHNIRFMARTWEDGK